MRVTEFIGNHIPKVLPVVNEKHICKMCGEETDHGVKNMIQKTFTDHAYLQNPSGELLCENCAACLGKIESPHTGKHTFFRNFSFLATEESLKLLKREEIMDILLSPPDGLFILAVTYSNKKHISFKTRIQCNREVFTVFTDRGEVPVNRGKVELALDTIQPLYTIKAETKQEPTWFTKTEILQGCQNNKRIEEYGIEKYFRANEAIKQWRGTEWLKLAVFALNKGRVSGRNQT